MIALQRFAYINSTETSLWLTVEPWADQYIIKPGVRVNVVVRGDSADEYLEVEQHPGGVTIHGYAGCVISLSSNGQDLVPTPKE